MTLRVRRGLAVLLVGAALGCSTETKPEPPRPDAAAPPKGTFKQTTSETGGLRRPPPP